MEEDLYIHPGALVLFTGNASPGRILEIKQDAAGRIYYNVIVRRGGEPVIQRLIYPHLVVPYSEANLIAMLGGPSSITVRDEDGPDGDFHVTVLCEAPQSAAA